MATSVKSYGSIVAARTRAAEQILGSKSLLNLYEEVGGLRDDLLTIRDLGMRAEALSQAQSAAQAVGGAATLGVLEAFAALQREYSAVMAIVQAVRRDLQVAGADTEVLVAVDRILVNEAEVAVRTVDGGVDAEGKPVQKKVRRIRASQEALRAEIVRDTTALLALKPAHAALAKRRVDAKRLGKLKGAAEALAGKLAERATAKGAAKGATAGERQVVAELRRAWGAHYRILAAVGRRDQRIAALLAEAARAR